MKKVAKSVIVVGIACVRIYFCSSIMTERYKNVTSRSQVQDDCLGADKCPIIRILQETSDLFTLDAPSVRSMVAREDLYNISEDPYFSKELVSVGGECSRGTNNVDRDSSNIVAYLMANRGTCGYVHFIFERKDRPRDDTVESPPRSGVDVAR